MSKTISILIGSQVGFPNDHIQLLLFYGSTSLVALSLLIFEITKSQPVTHTTLRLLWTSDRPVAETSVPDNAQYLHETDIQALGRIQTRNPSQRNVPFPRLRPHGHWNQLLSLLASRHTQTCYVPESTTFEKLCLYYSKSIKRR